MNILTSDFSDTFSILWLALFPLTYIAHVVEEYYCDLGYSAYLLRTYNVEFPPTRFLVLQSFGLVLMSVAIIFAIILEFPYTMLVILGTTVLVNGIIHALRRLIDGRYGPGLVTGITLWIPLGMVTLLRIWGSMPTTRFLFAASIGVVINGAVELISMRGGRLIKARY